MHFFHISPRIQSSFDIELKRRLGANARKEEINSAKRENKFVALAIASKRKPFGWNGTFFRARLTFGYKVLLAEVALSRFSFMSWLRGILIEGIGSFEIQAWSPFAVERRRIPKRCPGMKLASESFSPARKRNNWIARHPVPWPLDCAEARAVKVSILRGAPSSAGPPITHFTTVRGT